MNGKKTTGLTREERAALRKCLQILNKFQEMDTEMQMPKAVTLLTIALNEGISLTELAQKTAQAVSSTSRNVASLSPIHRKGKEGHGLVLNIEDPNNRRLKQHLLTPKGHKVIADLLQTMYE